MIEKKTAYEIGKIVGEMDWMGLENHNLTPFQLQAKAEKEIAFRHAIGLHDYEPIKEFMQGHIDGYRYAQECEWRYQLLRS